MKTDPVRNRYLLGLGLGLCIGSFANDRSQKIVLVFGLAIAIVSLILARREVKNGKG